MQNLAARDWEDALQVSSCWLSFKQFLTTFQCAIPVFEGLLPTFHDTAVQDILFTLAYWHALAKLRMHTDSTLVLLRGATSSLGTLLRRFIKYTCSAFDTRELPTEVATRGRRQKRKQTNKTDLQHDSTQPLVASQPSPTANSSAKKKHLNLMTYKLHALGDYVSQIMRFGTTDSYSTQRACTFCAV
jgi:hypothetical protein